jgi:uncharacterized RDD family membrane protein YckC
MNNKTFLNQLPESAYAVFYQRFFAFLLDLIIIFFIPLAMFIFSVKAGNLVFAELSAYVAAASGLIFYIYHMVMHKIYGATIGKMSCKIKVVRLDLKPLGYKEAFLRTAPYIVIFPLISIITSPALYGFSEDSQAAANSEGFNEALQFAWYVFSIIWILKDRYNRTLHDLLAKTVVIKA